MTIDEPTLEQIAQLTGGRYFRATDAAALRAIYAEIDRLEKAPNVAEHQQRYVELYPLVVALGAGPAAARDRDGQHPPAHGSLRPRLSAMRFEAWPAVSCWRSCRRCSLLYAYGFRRQRQALAAFVEQDLAPRLLPRGRRRPALGARALPDRRPRPA